MSFLLTIDDVANHWDKLLSRDYVIVLLAYYDSTGRFFEKIGENGCWIGSKKSTTMCVQDCRYVENTL